MLHALVYDGAAPTEMPVDEAIARINPKQALVWIDCDSPTEAELHSLGTKLGFNELVVEDLKTPNQRTKLEHFTDHFHVALHDCELQPRGTSLITREIDVVFGDGWLVTVRQLPSDAEAPAFPIETVRRRFEGQQTERGSRDEGFLLWALLDVIVDRYFTVTDGIDNRIDQAEELLFPEGVTEPAQGRPSLRPVFELSKALVKFRRASTPLREVLAEILRREVPCVSARAVTHLGNVYDHVLRVNDLVESQRDILTNLRDAELSVFSNRMNENMQRLTSWGAILIMATLITGVLGMNFRTAPDLDWKAGFVIIFGIMGAIALPMYWFFKRRKWL